MKMLQDNALNLRQKSLKRNCKKQTDLNEKEYNNKQLFNLQNSRIGSYQRCYLFLEGFLLFFIKANLEISIKILHAEFLVIIMGSCSPNTYSMRMDTVKESSVDSSFLSCVYAYYGNSCFGFQMSIIRLNTSLKFQVDSV